MNNYNRTGIDPDSEYIQASNALVGKILTLGGILLITALVVGYLYWMYCIAPY